MSRLDRPHFGAQGAAHTPRQTDQPAIGFNRSKRSGSGRLLLRPGARSLTQPLSVSGPVLLRERTDRAETAELPGLSRSRPREPHRNEPGAASPGTSTKWKGRRCERRPGATK